MLEDYNRLLEAQDQKRAEEWKNREERIKEKMSKMADTVVKRQDEANREMDRKTLQYQEQLEKQKAQEEESRKAQASKKMLDVKKHLDIQMMERQQLKQHEAHANVEFMKKWMDDSERDNQLRQEMAERKRQEELKLQSFLLSQSGIPEAQNGVPPPKKLNRKRLEMSPEEKKLNKEYILEIEQKLKMI